MFGVSACKSLAFIHGFTSCDTVSSHCPITFKNLVTVQCPMKIKENEFDTLRKFVYEAYGLIKLAQFKKWQTEHLISTPNVNLQMLVPSLFKILQHLKQACAQAGYFRKHSEIETNILELIEWGSKPLPNGSFVPPWQNEAFIDNVKPMIATCLCSKGNCSYCSCKKSSMK